MIIAVKSFNQWFQGRIQDLKLGVAQMGWKILKPGGGGIWNTITYFIVYISNTIYFKYDFKYNILYHKAPYLYNIVIKKSYFEKF